MKSGNKRLLATLLTLAAATAASAAGGSEPYAPDARFNNGQVLLDAFHATAPKRITGEKVVLDEETGDTIIAGLIPQASGGQPRGLVVVARYGPDGKHKLWPDASPGAVDASKKYVYVPYNVAPSNVLAIAVRDVSIGSYGDVSVLIDSRDATTNTRSVVATFGPTGEYKGVITHMASVGVDDVGAKMLPWGSAVFIVSSQPAGDGPGGNRVVVGKYTINLSDGVPALDTTFGTNGFVSLAHAGCSRAIGSPPINVPIPCDLRAERAQIEGTDIYIAGDFENSRVGQPSPNRDLFVMKLSTFGAPVTTFGTNGVLTYGSDTLQESLRGLVVRKRNQWSTDIFLLEAFPRPCGHGFIVPQFNAATGAYIDRSLTMGGGSNADPNVCAGVDWLLANDMALPVNDLKSGRYLGVVGSHLHAEPFTGADAFLALFDTQDLQAAPQLQDFTRNSGQFPNDSVFGAVVGKVEDNTFTAVGSDIGYDGDVSTAMTLRMQQDRIFRNGLEY